MRPELLLLLGHCWVLCALLQHHCSAAAQLPRLHLPCVLQNQPGCQGAELKLVVALMQASTKQLGWWHRHSSSARD